MKHYDTLLSLGCFSRDDVRNIVGNEATARSLINGYENRGLIERVRRDLYAAIDLENNRPVSDRYVIASHISAESYITHHSAFEFYGCTEQAYDEVYVSSEGSFSDFLYRGVDYCYRAPHISVGIIESNGVRVTDMERTILDSIKDFEKIGSLEELLNCIDNVSDISEKRLCAYLDEYGKKALYAKAGFILSHFKAKFGLSEDFFEHCKEKANGSIQYFYRDRNKRGVLHDKEWNMFVPTNLLKMIGKA